MKRIVKLTLCSFFISLIVFFFSKMINKALDEKKTIKYFEFNPTLDALNDTMQIDISTVNNEIHTCWIDLLSYLATIYGGDFKKYKKDDLKKILEKLKSNETIEEITSKMKFFPYYKECYGAVLAEFLGYYDAGDKKEYGLKVYSPIAKTFPYNHYDDFGVSRDFGYKRRHLGHDLMCATGTPVIAIESGMVEIIGWNRYGGWRIGIKSFDKKRYYYYAHLRKNRPYISGLKIGDKVEAGQVIGYVGRTGYSNKENINNIKQSHLHLGLQIIFDESQKNEIWIDLFALTNLLNKNKSSVQRNKETKEFSRTNMP